MWCSSGIGTSKGRFKAKSRLNKSAYSLTGCKGRLIECFVAEFKCPVTVTRIYCRKHRGLIRRADALAHAWYWVWIANGYTIKLAIVHTELECSVFYRWIIRLATPIMFKSVPCIHGQHFGHVMLLEFSCSVAGLLWLWMNSLFLRQILFYLMLSCLELTWMSVLYM